MLDGSVQSNIFKPLYASRMTLRSSAEPGPFSTQPEISCFEYGNLFLSNISPSRMQRFNSMQIGVEARAM